MNVSKGFLKKLFGKDRIESVVLKENGFTIRMEKGEEIPLAFDQVKAVKSNFYFDQSTPYRMVTFVMKDEKEYTLNVSSDRAEIDSILQHYAKYQLQGDLPENVGAIKLILQYGLNDYTLRLENGSLIETKNGQESIYPLSTMEYYRVDKPSNLINLKFKDKKMFVRLSALHVTNLWLVMQILERVSEDKSWLI
ncbi:hypothetical protein EII17_07410 [Clostridiales bacterium COT073_COT-073]|nr:hypothetical protein EII17_07410 [Clostridiales bacterium COT073_COT-073]